MLTIGVDLGGTQIRAGLFDEAGGLLFKHEDLTLAHEGAEAVIGRIIEGIRRVVSYAQEQGHGENITGIGIGCPGPLDPFTGVVLSPSTLPGMVDIPLQHIVHSEFGLPVYVNNDANAAALGEWLYGSGRGTNNMIYLTISTGIGAGIVIDGRLLLGEQGSAGEVGHMIIDPYGPMCSCSNRGCWEACASGTAIADIAIERLANETSDSQLRQITGPVTAKEVITAALNNDRLAMEIMEQTRIYLGIGLINMINLFNPQKVVIGGGVSKAGDFLLQPAVDMAKQRSQPGMNDVAFVMAELGDDVGLYGAAALVSYQKQLRK
ncbi:ROK family protein [Paenibacillus thalictri]|uniref:ROK family protein n=1 Tax=Paenibacillus thalictri TaxID=2527873 RepID=A0A4Q9DVJ6_9BACL|nr:ROK family protein [Paenibacillus thalictri]TBL79011.1 ROK family protein [Paenibacillus thalictri]